MYKTAESDRLAGGDPNSYESFFEDNKTWIYISLAAVVLIGIGVYVYKNKNK